LTILTPGQPFPEEFPKGALLLVDKPLAWTSFDVVNKVRYNLSRKLGVKRVKIGHAGTLDPLATGLLLICVGDYTKKIESLQGLPKVYTGTITFGATTPSYDLEKAIDATFPTDHLTDEMLQKATHQFIGEIQQLPPIYSAVKVEGRRLYKNARTGEEVELPMRTVYIESYQLGPLYPVKQERTEPVLANVKGAPIMLHPDYAEGVQCDFRVECGKGTYIRSLAKDTGEAVNTGAYLSSLRRVATSGYSVEDAWQVHQLVEWITGG
jgi:tRNA pseudouridine55 synthase